MFSKTLLKEHYAGIYESLSEMLAEVTLWVETDIQARGMDTRSAPQRKVEVSDQKMETRVK